MGPGARVATSLTVTALHAEPTRRSEQVTETLLGEPLALLESRVTGSESWARVAGADAYSGWLPATHVTELDARWREAERLRVRALSTTVTTEGGETLCPALFGSRFALLDAHPVNAFRVMLPDGRVGCLPRGAREPFYGDRGRGIAQLIDDVASSLAGIPYRWGGRSAWGFDCSGLVQMVLGELGVSLPRDSHLMEDDLAARAERVELDACDTGDVIFWGAGERATHVGIALDRERFLHARGWVRVGRFGSGVDADLARVARGAYRLPALSDG